MLHQPAGVGAGRNGEVMDADVFGGQAATTNARIGADGEGAQRPSGFDGPLFQGLLQKGNRRNKEEHRAVFRCEAFGDFQRGERLAGSACHDELAAIMGAESGDDVV